MTTLPNNFKTQEEWENYKKCFNSLKVGDRCIDDRGVEWHVREVYPPQGNVSGSSGLNRIRSFSDFAGASCYVQYTDIIKFVKFIKKQP